MVHRRVQWLFEAIKEPWVFDEPHSVLSIHANVMHNLYLFTPMQHSSFLKTIQMFKGLKLEMGQFSELTQSWFSPKSFKADGPKTFKELSDYPLLWISLPSAAVWFSLETADRDAQKVLRYMSVSCCVLWHFFTMLRQRCTDRVWIYINVQTRKSCRNSGKIYVNHPYTVLFFLLLESS